MRMVLTLMLSLAGGGFLAGCSSHAGKQVNAVTLDQFVKGKTSKADVLALLGKPQGSVQTPDGEALHYVFTRSNINGASFVPVVGLFAGKVTAETEMVTVNFDKAGLFKDFFRSASEITAGPGSN